jgi:hypothetical protein
LFEASRPADMTISCADLARNLLPTRGDDTNLAVAPIWLPGVGYALERSQALPLKRLMSSVLGTKLHLKRACGHSDVLFMDGRFMGGRVKDPWLDGLIVRISWRA